MSGTPGTTRKSAFYISLLILTTTRAQLKVTYLKADHKPKRESMAMRVMRQIQLGQLSQPCLASPMHFAGATARGSDIELPDPGFESSENAASTDSDSAPELPAKTRMTSPLLSH